MKIKKWAKFIMVPLVVVSVAAAIAGCSSKTTTGTATQLTYKVQKGSVALTITAVGNVNYSDVNTLSFDTGGTLSEVDVSAGDSVKKGDVLAKLDSTGYQQTITSLQEQLAQKNVALAQAQQQLTQDEQAVTNAQNSVTTAQNNLTADQYALTKTQNSLQQIQAQAQLTLANDALSVKQAQYAFDTNTGGSFASDKLALAKQQQTNDQASTQANIEDAQNAVTSAQNKISSDQAALTSAQNGVTNAQASLDIGKLSLANAQQAVTDAQSNLDQANATSPEITAPIDGLITVVNTTAGQTIYKGQTIVTLVDPNSFEADVSIGESNVSDVQVGGNAVIQFDALPGVALPGEIASIAPTSTTTQGVVSYPVTVKVTSLQNLTAGLQRNPGTQGSGQSTSTTGQLSGTPRTGSSSSAGPSGQFAPPTGGASSSSNASSQPVQLRQGMTATVNITYQIHSNVLVVPNSAITRTGNTATVKVLVNGVPTEKTIQTGLTNSTVTEVTSGLNEGDEVVYTRTVSSSSSSSSTSRGNGLFGGAGGGGGGVIIRGG